MLAQWSVALAEFARQNPSMESIASTVAAVTALLAAIFSGLGLVVASRREDRQWTRQVLLDSYVDFLELDMRGTSIARDLLRARVGIARKNRGREMTEAEMWLAHNRCQELTTRARLLGGKAANESMYAAHAVFDDYLAMLSDPSAGVSTDTLQDMLLRSVEAYEQLVLNARRELRVRRAKRDRWQWRDELKSNAP